MNIGDKIKFDCHLPYSSSGKLLNKIKDPTRPWGWDSTIATFTNDTETNHIYGWEVKKIENNITTGTFLGFTNRKLKRIYNRPITRRDDFTNDSMTISVQNLLETIIPESTSTNIFARPMARSEVFEDRDRRNSIIRHGRSNYRVDNKYKLDKIAIIGVSKFKRYYVDYKDIIRLNLNDKLEVL